MKKSSARLRTFVLTSLLVSSGLCTANSYAEDILQVYQIAQQNDPVIRAAKLEYEAVGFGVDEARGGLLPTLAGSYTHTTTKQDIISSDNAVFAVGSTSYPQKDLGLSLTQPIFRLGAWYKFDQAKASERMAAAVYAAAQQDLIIRVATAYVGVLVAKNALTFAQAEHDSIQNQLELAKNKFQSGQATIVNMSDAEARAALNESNLVLLQNDLNDKIQALEEITGQAVDPVPLSEHMMMTLPDPMDINQWITSAQQNNITIKARTEAVEVARNEVKKQQAAYAPTLDLTYTTDKNDTGGSLFGGGSDVKTNNVILRLNVPIWDGGVTHAVSQAAAKRHEESMEDLDHERRVVDRQTRSSYTGIVGGVQRVAALEKSVSSLETARQLKEEGYKSGLFTVVAVLDAERDLFAARRDEEQARYDYIMNRLKLKQAAGALSVDDLYFIAGRGPATPTEATPAAAPTASAQ